MLHEILHTLEHSTTALCLEDLAQRLDVNQAALEGMLQTLVQRGYLIEVVDAASPCSACAWRGGCAIMTTARRRYAPARIPQ